MKKASTRSRSTESVELPREGTATPDRRTWAGEKPSTTAVLPVTGVVLAGGGSRRFGSSKAWHEVDGKPMVMRVLDEVRALANEVLLSVRSPSDFIEGYACVADRFPGEGPLAGLHASLLAASHDWVLAVACDLPFVVVDDLNRLLLARENGVDAIVARDSSGKLHPHCGCYHISVLPVVEEMLGGSERAMHELLDRLEVFSVPLPDKSLVNVNRISDLSD
ncbi:MAG: molybdenum cofactor guanylyltransferase [Rhodothermia bacterium]|nr:molybdenum cofactor guanylyltransferase [Rhodothermia bacterium]